MNPASALVASNAVTPAPAVGAPPQAAGHAKTGSFENVLKNLASAGEKPASSISGKQSKKNPTDDSGRSALAVAPVANPPIPPKAPLVLEPPTLAPAGQDKSQPAPEASAATAKEPASSDQPKNPAPKAGATSNSNTTPVHLQEQRSATEPAGLTPDAFVAPSPQSREQPPQHQPQQVQSDVPHSSAPAAEIGLPTPAQNTTVPLLPEHLAFSLRLTQSDTTPQPTTAQQTSSPTRTVSAPVTTAILAKAESTIVREVPRQPAQTGDHSQVLGSSSRAPEIRPAARPAESRSQAPNEGNNAARNPTPLAQSNKESIPRSSVRDFVALSAGPLTNSAAPAIHVESRSPLPLEVAEPIRANPSLAPQEVHATPPEPPQINLNNQILLHLSGNDHASAAVRVMDRGGAVNVSVHAPDPELRNSLRSNLGELASQLTNQGWKTDVVKTAAPANSEHARGSGTPDERSSSQQQSSGNSERQPQRDRRANGRWLQEFEQQTSGQSGNSGGKN